MKTISPIIFLSNLANGIKCCIYHFTEEKILSKAIDMYSIDIISVYSLNKSKRKKLLYNTHPSITTETINHGNKSSIVKEIYIPVLNQIKKEGLLWLFLNQNEEEVFNDNFLNMINTLSEIFTLLIKMEGIKEVNSLYSQSALFIANLLSNGVLLYDIKDNLLFHNSAADKMNIVNINSSKLTNKVLDINTSEFFLGNKLIGKIKYTSSHNNKTKITENKSTRNKNLNKIIGKNPEINRVLSFISQVASTDSTVLLRGESGTGKEEYAKLLHNLSQRRKEPFVALNCAAIPENLLESELFGYAGGSFTGAKKEGKMGKFEMANTGTLFLDEVGDIPLSIQVKLLRVLQERYVEPVGSYKNIPIDVRIICATHQNLEKKISKGEFREDLFYRINVIPIVIPSLKNRYIDIELLLIYYTKKYCILQKKGFMTFSYEAMERLKNYHWQGNIRELINIVEYCVTVSNKNVIDITMLPAYIQFDKPNKAVDLHKVQTNKSSRPTNQELLKLVAQFGNTAGGKKELAKHLNISLATLYRWISKCK